MTFTCPCVCRCGQRACSSYVYPSRMTFVRLRVTITKWEHRCALTQYKHTPAPLPCTQHPYTRAGMCIYPYHLARRSGNTGVPEELHWHTHTLHTRRYTLVWHVLWQQSRHTGARIRRPQAHTVPACAQSEVWRRGAWAHHTPCVCMCTVGGTTQEVCVCVCARALMLANAR